MPRPTKQIVTPQIGPVEIGRPRIDKQTDRLNGPVTISTRRRKSRTEIVQTGVDGAERVWSPDPQPAAAIAAQVPEAWQPEAGKKAPADGQLTSAIGHLLKRYTSGAIIEAAWEVDRMEFEARQKARQA